MKKIIILTIMCFYVLAYTQQKYTPINNALILEGKFKRENDNTTIELIPRDHYALYIEGFTKSYRGDIKSLYGLGVWNEKNQQITYKIPIYTLIITIINKDTFSVEESGFNPNFGFNVASFKGLYNRID